MEVKIKTDFDAPPQCPDTAAFLRNLEALPKDERHACLMVTGTEVTATLAQLVSCVGCRRAVENLYQVLGKKESKEGKEKRRDTEEREQRKREVWKRKIKTELTIFEIFGRKGKNWREERRRRGEKGYRKGRGEKEERG